MKMFKTLFCVLVLGLLFPVFVSAQVSFEKIEIQGDRDDLQHRSLIPANPVFASTDGVSLYSDFTMAIGEVTILVTDQAGKTVVQKSLLVFGEQNDVISLSSLPKGMYKVCYLLGGHSFYGTFDIG